MQSLLGFWCFQVRSHYITQTDVVFRCDDGFGNLIASSVPVYAIQCLDFPNHS